MARSQRVLCAVLVLCLFGAALASYSDAGKYTKKAARETNKWHKKPYKHQSELQDSAPCPCAAAKQSGRADSNCLLDEEDVSSDEQESTYVKRVGDAAVRYGSKQASRDSINTKQQTSQRSKRDQQTARKLQQQKSLDSEPAPSDDWTDTEEEVSEFPECQRYAHDSYKLAKCERKARSEPASQTPRKTNTKQRQPAPTEVDTQSEELGEIFPQCQKYANDEYKLAKCERKAKSVAPQDEISPQSAYPQCEKYAYDPYKLANCERKFKSNSQTQKPISSDSITEPIAIPQCQKYTYDPIKLAKCENKFKVNSPQQVQNSPLEAIITYPGCERYVNDPYKLDKCEERAKLTIESAAGGQVENPKYAHCQRYANDPYKLAKCEQKADVWSEIETIATQALASGQTELHFPHCQKYAFDPYKQAKCENKAQFMANIIKENAGQEGEERQTNPLCQHLAYDPYKLAKCEFKIKKYATYNNNNFVR